MSKDQEGRASDAERVRVEAPQRTAAGLAGVAAGLQHVSHQVGLRRGARTLLRMNQPDGFDCPGCAWPEPAHPSHLELCENGAKAVAEEATTRRVDRAFFARHPIGDLRERSELWLGQQGRLTEPMWRPEGADHYEPISWDAALDLVSARLRATSPDRAVFYTSGRTSNEAAFAYQLFVRRFGTNNLPDCSNMCHESSGVALTETIGVGKGTVTLDDIHHADLLLIIGQNPGTNHPRMLTALEAAKRRGATIVAINPLPEAGLLRFQNPKRVAGLVGRGTALADLFLPIRVGADLALFQLVNQALVQRDALDHAFLAEHCDGAEDLRAHLQHVDAADLLAATGLDASDVDRLVDLVAASPRIIACWAMGLTQHRGAVATIREIVNTLLLRGSIGRPGAGACPVRGHSNVQGDRTMGIHERPSDDFLDRLGAALDFEPPREPGYDTVEAIEAMAAGRVDVFFAMGGNFVAAAPDTEATRAALGRCALTVQVSTKLNRSHLDTGREALLLPCLGRTERDTTGGREQLVSVEDSMSVVHGSRGRNEPASPHLRSEVSIVCDLAARTVGDEGIDWGALADDYDRIRDLIEQVVPGFDDVNARVRVPGGFTLPNGPRDDRSFATTTGRARLTVNRFEPVEVPAGRLLLQTIRSHDQYNTTIYGLDDRYRGIHGGRRVLLVAPADLDELGFTDGETIDIVSEWPDERERRAVGFRLVAYPTPPGTCAAYFPEANVLVPLGSTAEGSRTPTSKAVVVRLERR
ncbi:MAG: FdhF/YdeP family oxidoreductase [Acidimicrobiales bacterium]